MEVIKKKNPLRQDLKKYVEKKDDEEIQQELSLLNNREDRKSYIRSLIPAKRKNAVKASYMANYHLDEKHYYHDVRFLEGEEYKGQVDLFVGGSPCQSFTLLGYQKGLEEARGTLFYEFARLVKEIEPKVFIYENVQGLMKHDKGRTWEVVQRVFDSLGYTIHSDILDAVNYGLPQKRRRVFVVGFKKVVISSFYKFIVIPINTFQRFTLPASIFVFQESSKH